MISGGKVGMADLFQRAPDHMVSSIAGLPSVGQSRDEQKEK